jgi:hypothetical protein
VNSGDGGGLRNIRSISANDCITGSALGNTIHFLSLIRVELALSFLQSFAVYRQVG